MKKNTLACVLTGLGAIGLAACASSMPTAVPTSYLEGNILSRSDIGVTKKTEFLEVDIDPRTSQLSQADRARITNFVRKYTDKGHGQLIMSLPASSSNPQLAVAAVAEARAIAWENGVEYEEIAGSNHGAGSGKSEPLIMAFQVYEAIVPECQSFGTLDVADVRSNNEMETLGCAIRHNQAVMIADAGDLLGQRALGNGDNVRRDTILAKFRQGESTSAARSSDESGNVSDAVGN